MLVALWGLGVKPLRTNLCASKGVVSTPLHAVAVIHAILHWIIKADFAG
ncbi:MAG: hypothetical protein KGO49_14950 [Gammaproteobacteria bacterium]|nr:hypothetical protein [Gammaproteobacteria bacterium]